jgi:hypothetical protein
VCWPKTNAEGGIESTSRGDARKDQQQGGKAGTEEIGGALRIGGKSLSETSRAAPTQSAKQPTNQKKMGGGGGGQGRG